METNAPARKLSLPEMADAFRAAKAAANAIPIPTGLDGGTCNFDNACFPRGRRSEADIKAFASAAGCDVHFMRWFGRNYAFLDVGQHAWQGSHRTRMSEAACRELEAHGVEGATMYYQMD